MEHTKANLLVWIIPINYIKQNNVNIPWNQYNVVVL